jgi:hypothetical protein
MLNAKDQLDETGIILKLQLGLIYRMWLLETYVAFVSSFHDIETQLKI